MGGKHLKRLRAEKAKVQLKKKKILPKGQNITNTTFQIKKISLVEQLAPRAGHVPVTSRNLTLKDLINQLSHHNMSTKLSALDGIKELFGTYHLLNGLSLRQVISRVLDVAVDDVERKVRRSGISLLSWLILPLSTETKAQFTDLLSKQVLRALSHIHAGTQRDALRLVDLLLAATSKEDLPKLHVFINYLVRLLTMSGVTAVSRHTVVRRLLAVCRAVSSEPQESKLITNQVGVKDVVGPLTNVYKVMAPLPLAGAYKTSLWDVADVKPMVDALMNALMGVWTECSPDDYLIDSSAKLLSDLVNLIIVIYEFIGRFDAGSLREWFVSSFRKTISKNFFGYFPYRWISAPARASRQPDPEDMPDQPLDFIALNLGLSKIYFWFKLKLNLIESKIENFIFECLDSRPVSPEMPDLVQCLLSIPRRRDLTMKKLADSYVEAPDPSLLPLLSAITTSPKFSHYVNEPYIENWVASLSHGLADAPYEHVQLVLSLTSRGGYNALVKNIQMDVNNLVRKGGDLDAHYKCLLHIVYWCCSPDLIKSAAESDSCPLSVKNYLENILSY